MTQSFAPTAAVLLPGRFHGEPSKLDDYVGRMYNVTRNTNLNYNNCDWAAAECKVSKAAGTRWHLKRKQKECLFAHGMRMCWLVQPMHAAMCAPVQGAGLMHTLSDKLVAITNGGYVAHRLVCAELFSKHQLWIRPSCMLYACRCVVQDMEFTPQGLAGPICAKGGQVPFQEWWASKDMCNTSTTADVIPNDGRYVRRGQRSFVRDPRVTATEKPEGVSAVLDLKPFLSKYAYSINVEVLATNAASQPATLKANRCDHVNDSLNNTVSRWQHLERGLLYWFMLWQQ